MLKSFFQRAHLTSLTFILLLSLIMSPEALFALSSDTHPLASNIFVEIAKKQNPAVVNVSTKSKAEELPRRNFPIP